MPRHLEGLLQLLRSVRCPVVTATTSETVPAHQPGGGGGPLRLAGEPGGYFQPFSRYHELPRLPQAVSWPYTLFGRIQVTLYQVGLERSSLKSVV